MREPIWHRLFPDEDFRWAMNLRPGNPAEFFQDDPRSGELREMRRRLLEESPHHYALLSPQSGALVADALEFLSVSAGNFRDLDEAAREVASDWVLLEPDERGRFSIAAGAVCFPSHWSLPEKAGRPLHEVHGPVPRLNDSLARSIDTFLAKLAPGICWERENWGLTADERLDQHPRHRLRELDGSQDLDMVWVRLEQQLFARFAGGGLYFGISVSHHRLDRLVEREPGLAPRVAKALRSMPEEVARYKSLNGARSALAERLELRAK